GSFAVGILGGLSIVAGVAVFDPSLIVFAMVVAVGLPPRLVLSMIRADRYRAMLPRAAAVQSGGILAIFAVALAAAEMLSVDRSWYAPVYVYAAVTWGWTVIALLGMKWRLSGAHCRELIHAGRATWAGVSANLLMVHGRQLSIPYIVAGMGGLPAAAGLRGA